MTRSLIGAFILGSLFLSSGCGALILLGVGGTAGYMIKKGEDSGGGGKGAAKSSASKPADTKNGGAPKAAAVPKTSSPGAQQTSTSD